MHFFTRLARKQLMWILDLHLMKQFLFQTGIISTVADVCCYSSMPVASCQWNIV